MVDTQTQKLPPSTKTERSHVHTKIRTHTHTEIQSFIILHIAKNHTGDITIEVG